ncbi:hypothetical protein LOTGIDRAFT_221916 [Lottia gigantea]|uniref:SAM domain-containing protein n=1 Tax=Lottia gigantea TaxID=225164 RepID=V3ZKH9_LOTGI|nr:hypothetical protein LOTGIDRAFT_221916 [Lottia gigantea]ESO84792.1 hypothetical protein LOTGIDRAFT_221916 [Lottia gigantea]
MCSVKSWSCDDVGNWLKENGLEDYVPLLCEQHKVDGPALLALTEDDLKNPPLNIQVLGHVKKLSLKLGHLKEEDIECRLKRYHVADTVIDGFKTSRKRFSNFYDRNNNDTQNEILKPVLCFIYALCVSFLVAIGIVVCDNRVPDIRRNPPLPDLFLDNVAFVPWAFKASEIIYIIMVSIGFSLSIFHKNRSVMLRRFFYMQGTLMFLRLFTILLTSLSVPGVHLYKYCKKYTGVQVILQQAVHIISGIGLSVGGVRTCGDLFFSGHTVNLTLINLTIIEYSYKTRIRHLRILTWLLNLFGMLFILAGHEHYSIDVVVAFFLTYGFFMYYHALAYNRSLMQRDAKRTRIWLPFFKYFESNCAGAVPNEFECPLFSWTSFKKRLTFYRDNYIAV